MNPINVVSVFGAISLFGAGYTAWHAWFAFVSRRWPTVSGRAILLGIYGTPVPEGEMYAPFVHYEYFVNGIRYESKRLRFGASNPFSAHIAAAELSPEMRAGNLRVHYDPSNPKRACLIAGLNEWTFALPALLSTIGITSLLLGIWPEVLLDLIASS